MTDFIDDLVVLQKGGFVMYFLLLLSLLVVAIGVERLLYYHRQDAGRAFARDFAACMADGSYDSALNMISARQEVLPRLMCAALLAARSAIEMTPRAAASAYMEVQSGVALARLRDHLYTLSVIVTMAPLLGLLGTISGMIGAFSVFHVQSGQATAITGGVGEALIATATGLCVAIVALVVHAYFVQRQEKIVTDMEECFSLMETHIDVMLRRSEAGE